MPMLSKITQFSHIKGEWHNRACLLVQAFDIHVAVQQPALVARLSKET